MSRIRLVGGTITKTTGGDHNMYSDGNIVFNSGQAVTETSDTGIKYGDPKEAPKKKLISLFFIKGWWTNENNELIAEALLGDIVKFHLETKNIPDGDIVSMTLYDDDRRVKPLEEDGENDKIELNRGGKEVLHQKVTSNKIIVTIHLKNIDSQLKNEADGSLELFFACSYKKENKDFPLHPKEYLKLKGMPKIIFVNGHWKTAKRTPFGTNFGPIEPKKPYWVNGIENKMRDYLNIESKFNVNNISIKTSTLEEKGYILYYDGSSDHAFDQSGQDRFKNGEKFAEDNFKEITQGLGNEAVYLVSHSEGGAYASGIADYLNKNGCKVGEHILLSPDEGDEFEINPVIPSYQLLYMFFSSVYNPVGAAVKLPKFKRWGSYYAVVDWVVNEYKVKGVKKMGIVHYQDAGWTGVHGWTNGSNVFKKVADLKEVQTFDIIGEHKGKFYSGKDQSKTSNGTKFYRVNDDYIITNCPPLIEIK
ncbi:hypothetical protein [Flavobacterium sp. N2038]|uniref:hypothetical protein n=1 Tax=Flavobacterium sp. N2038 TaxID=2986829 RepID=UPI002224714F|nr:hypothetical protein [Flavobacterium sp. N2038]